MGRVPADWEGAGRFSPSGDTAAYGVDVTSKQGRDVDIPSTGGGNGRGGTAGDKDLRHPFPKHCRSIYCNKSNYVPVSGGGMVSGGAGFKAVMGSEEPLSGEDIGGGTGGGCRKLMR